MEEKFQYTKSKLVADLERSEKEHGLTFIAFYMSIKFGDFGLFNGITIKRLINSA